MKKLLYTTAIAGLALTYATVSSAETKVSGNLGISYFASSDDTAAATNTSLNGFGRESQLNISNSGDLNNGMKYAAGFSFESDGSDNATSASGLGGENVYIDLISGNTTLSVGSDHFQNSDRHMTNLVGFGYIGANGASQEAQSIYITNPSNYGAYGVGLLQKTTVGSIGINYTPNAIAGLATNDVGNTLTKVGVEGVSGAAATNAKSATEVSFDGDLGVKGLQVFASKKMQDRANVAGTLDLDTHRMAAKYSTGAFTIAVDKAKLENGTNEFNSSSVGVAYSLSENASIGYTRAKADSNVAASVDEKTDMIAIGYNLGAVSVQAQYKDVEALGGVTNNDGKLFGLYLGTKF